MHSLMLLVALGVAPPSEEGKKGPAAPERAGEGEVKKLPAAVDDVAVGGGGRYLVLHLGRLRKLAIFDVRKGEVTKYLAVAGDHVLFAAGSDKLVVALPESKVLQRWDLATGEREAVAKLPEEEVRALCMGSASAGPVLLVLNRRPPNGVFLDLATLKPREVVFEGEGPVAVESAFLRASPDGRLFCSRWGVGGEPHMVHVLALTGNRAKPQTSWIAGSLLLPSADGQRIYAECGVYTPELKRLFPREDRPNTNTPFFPAHQGGYFLRFTGGTEDKGTLAFFLPGHETPFATLEGVEGYVGKPIHYGTAPDKMMHDKRVHFLPDDNLLVTIPLGNDRLVLRKIDTEAMLRKAGVDYLFVTSRPPSAVRAGERLSYEITAKASKGKPKFKVEAGPKGMKVSGKGKLTWKVPKGAAGTRHDVIIALTSGGQEAYHSFTLQVTE